MIVNARYTVPCADCGASTDEPCEGTCLSQLVTAPPAVPLPRAGSMERHHVPVDEVVVGDMRSAPTPRRELPTTSSVWLGEREGLSAREGAVMALIVLGLSNQQIASALYVSMHSTKTHIRSAYRKMGVTSRTQAIMWGVDHGFQLYAPATRLDDGAQR